MMKNALLLLIVAGCFASCSRNPEKSEPLSETGRLEIEALALAKDYAGKQLDEKNTTVNNQNGLIVMSDGEKDYVIDPSATLVGRVNRDTVPDAIISISSYFDKEFLRTEHLILIQKNGRLELEQTVESDMKIVMLKDRIITTEHHTKPRTSPLYNCPTCIEIIDYTYENGELVKLE